MVSQLVKASEGNSVVSFEYHLGQPLIATSKKALMENNMYIKILISLLHFNIEKFSRSTL